MTPGTLDVLLDLRNARYLAEHPVRKTPAGKLMTDKQRRQAGLKLLREASALLAEAHRVLPPDDSPYSLADTIAPHVEAVEAAELQTPVGGNLTRIGA